MKDLVTLFKGHFGKFKQTPDREVCRHPSTSRYKLKTIPWSDAQEPDTYSIPACYGHVDNPTWMQGEKGDLVHLSKKDRGGGLNEIPD